MKDLAGSLIMRLERSLCRHSIDAAATEETVAESRQVPILATNRLVGSLLIFGARICDLLPVDWHIPLPH